MKKFENKITSMPFDGKGKMVEYAWLALQCVQSPKEGGFDVAEMDKRLRLVKSFTDVESSPIELEDADFDKLKELVTTNKWAVIHQDIVDFVKYVETL